MLLVIKSGTQPLQLTFVDGAAVLVGVVDWVRDDEGGCDDESLAYCEPLRELDGGCEPDGEGACETEGLGVVVLLGDRLSDADIGCDAEATCEGLCEASLEFEGLADRELVDAGVSVGVAELLGGRDAEGSVVRL